MIQYTKYQEPNGRHAFINDAVLTGKEVYALKILRYPEDIRRSGAEVVPRCVLALGFFDGVHLAHRELISLAKHRAQEHGVSLAVFTFPSESFDIKASSTRIYPTEKKLALLEQIGVDIAYVADFSSIKGIEAEDFAIQTIATELNAVCAVCGYNFRFGNGARGDASLLADKLSELGKECIILPEYSFRNSSLSSSLIRSALKRGDVELAASALGLPYFIEGEVRHGDGRGAGLGIPTVNIDRDTPDELLKRGVYLSCAYIDGERYPAITNVGICPTFEVRPPHSETFIFNFSKDIYGEKVRIYFLSYLREEERFESEKELIMQINVDKTTALNRYGEIKWQELGLS